MRTKSGYDIFGSLPQCENGRFKITMSSCKTAGDHSCQMLRAVKTGLRIVDLPAMLERSYDRTDCFPTPPATAGVGLFLPTSFALNALLPESWVIAGV